MRKVRHRAKFDYQLDRHCSKTDTGQRLNGGGFDYQLDRHCSKTILDANMVKALFDYQLDRHCSKTAEPTYNGYDSLITS